MIRFWRHVSYNLREGGPRRVLSRIVDTLAKWAWSEETWLIYTQSTARLTYLQSLPLEHAVLNIEDLKEHGYFKLIAFPESIRDRIRVGEQCNGFFWDGALVNVGWISVGYLVLDGRLRINLGDGVGVYDCFTLPGHRSKGIYTETLIRMVKSIRENAGTAAFIAVDPGNVFSVRGIERAGFQPYYALKRRRRFGSEKLIKSEFCSRPDREAPKSGLAHQRTNSGS